MGGRQYLFAILVFAGTMALSAVGLLIYRGLCRRHEKKQGGETSKHPLTVQSGDAFT